MPRPERFPLQGSSFRRRKSSARPINAKFRNNLARMILQTKFTGKSIFVIQIIVRDQALIKLNIKRSIILYATGEVVQNTITELLWQPRLHTINSSSLNRR